VDPFLRLEGVSACLQTKNIRRRTFSHCTDVAVGIKKVYTEDSVLFLFFVFCIACLPTFPPKPKRNLHQHNGHGVGQHPARS